MSNKLYILYLKKDYKSIIDIYEVSKNKPVENIDLVYISLSFFYEERYRECLELTRGKINQNFLSSLDKYNLNLDIKADFLLCRYKIFMNQKSYYLAYKNLLFIMKQLPDEAFEDVAVRFEKIIFSRIYIVFDAIITLLCLLLFIYVKVENITGVYYYVLTVGMLLVLTITYFGRNKTHKYLEKYLRLYFRR